MAKAPDNSIWQMSVHFSACHSTRRSGILGKRRLCRYLTKSWHGGIGLCRKSGFSGFLQSFFKGIVSKRTVWRAIDKILANVGTCFSKLHGILRDKDDGYSLCLRREPGMRSIFRVCGRVRKRPSSEKPNLEQDRVFDPAAYGHGPMFQPAPDAIRTRGAKIDRSYSRCR